MLSPHIFEVKTINIVIWNLILLTSSFKYYSFTAATIHAHNKQMELLFLYERESPTPKRTLRLR